MEKLLDDIDGKQRSMIAAYLLWFFLGRFGVHRFYLGYRPSALAMLALTLAGTAAIAIAAWGSAKVDGSDMGAAMVAIMLAPNTLLGWAGDILLGVANLWWLFDAVYTYVMVRRRNNMGLVPAALIEPRG